MFQSHQTGVQVPSGKNSPGFVEQWKVKGGWGSREGMASSADPTGLISGVQRLLP